jgi:hypothetical protein
MARYMMIAADANKAINSLIGLIPEDCVPLAAPLIAHIYNYGIRTAPRAVQSTVRYNAVREACKGLPVNITMGRKKDERTGKEFNVIRIMSTSNQEVITEEVPDEE